MALTTDGNYADLTTVPGFDYYHAFEISGEHIGVFKVPAPIQDRILNRFANKMTLCGLIHRFNAYEELVYDFALGHQGIYKISKPGLNQQPVYFAFPFSAGLWWTDGPDLNIMYSTDDPFSTNIPCSPGFIELRQAYGIGPNNMLGHGQSVFGMSSSDERNVLATTDFNTISTFWSTNAITVGFLNFNDELHDAANNAYIFYPANNPPCDPLMQYPNAIQILDFDLSSSGVYEVRDKFFHAGHFSVGDRLLIHVVANFDNGDAIDQCQEIVLSPNPSAPTDDFRAVTVDIRGNIKDYDPNVVNYKVEVYDIP